MKRTLKAESKAGAIKAKAGAGKGKLDAVKVDKYYFTKVTKPTKPTDRDYAGAMAAKPKALKKVLTWEHANCQELGQKFALMKGNERVDPAVLSTIVWDWMKEQIKNPNLAYWRAVTIGKKNKGKKDPKFPGRAAHEGPEQETRRLMKLRMLSEALSQRQRSDNKTAQMDLSKVECVFEKAYVDSYYIDKLGALSAEDRLMTFLKLVEQWTYDKIAKVTGLGETTVRERVSGAIEKIKKIAGDPLD